MTEDTFETLKSKIEEKKELSEKMNADSSNNEEVEITENAQIVILDAEIDTLLKKYILYAE
ncbi:MAG: hypothetical protein PHP90_09760 [Sulfuricurvum sp.]|uniref:hypothetical protein n=1 Tax=Sulfuricurvum sp. TaxID=2025608 RepID=UPI002612544D|nr:hypothetical protein [Sulfuricurvum sp.]MDD5118862.1 hypothetical protein [Sulfuricurvum sp.]